jgi:CRP-like cAMP-binding protein
MLLSNQVMQHMRRADACQELPNMALPADVLRAAAEPSPAAAQPLANRAMISLPAQRRVVERHGGVRGVPDLLRRLCLQYGKAVGREVFLDVPLTQQDIADMIGASRQTVSGLLARMKERGLIQMVGRRMYVRDEALKAI